MPRIKYDRELKEPPTLHCGRCGVELTMTLKELQRLYEAGGVAMCDSCYRQIKRQEEVIG